MFFFVCIMSLFLRNQLWYSIIIIINVKNSSTFVRVEVPMFIAFAQLQGLR